MYRRAQIWFLYLLCIILAYFPLIGVRGSITTADTKTSDWCIAECMCLSKTQILCNTGGLTDIPSRLPSDLEQLSLSKNNFSIIRSDAFARLRSLRKLSLDNNLVGIIKPFAFRGLSKLESLSIQHTSLAHIDQFSFTALQNVSSVILAYNKIAYIMGKAFAGSSQIQYIVLSHNPLKTIYSNAFSGLTYVDHLLLPGGIRSIEPDAFNGLENVKNLMIQTSDLGIIYKDAFFGLEHIEALNILSNKIDAIEEFHLASNFSINVLRFHKNHVLRAPKYGDATFHVNTISADGNHFPCDCQIHLVLESDFVNGSVDEFRKHNFCIATADINGMNMSLVNLDSIASCHDRLMKDNYGSGVSIDFGAISFVVPIAFYLARLLLT
ncbi:leucine-rich repeat-containing protein 70-like isoform X2 [Phymastichus coffea]|uniref:leucine-rich repeat-containing protein 70-like isoform X2 n=1 Tax=Phymastichus coffea TaxID=108790 RepID=UPI00273C3245|nr:leucine-rich repeat-containing protein 70-like isoform X2 [Phymastichus coffea]